MIERLVKPILDIYKEMDILSAEGGKKEKAINALRKEYEEKEKHLEAEKDKIYEQFHQLSEKQLKLRRELAVSMRKANCPMTTIEIDGVLYGICSNTNTAIIEKITNTKEAEKLLAINKLEKSK